MPPSPPGPRPRLHGGTARVLELACRSLGYRHGVVAVLAGDGEGTGVRESVEPLASTGEDDERLLDVARAVVAAEIRGAVPEGVLAAPVLDEEDRVVGALCVSGAPADRDPAQDAPVLAAFTEVLQDQLDAARTLRRTLGPPLDAAAVDALRDALAAGEVRAWFQPIVRLSDDSLVGFEALARWELPGGDVARPGDFVPLAERTGLVADLDLVVLRDGLAQLARWHEQRPGLRLSVNLSGRHLDDPEWFAGVSAAVAESGVDPRHLDLELTESVRTVDVLHNAASLRAAREQGFAVWFDDFGTGWNELRQLVELPCDGVKVDRFFTEALGGRGDSVVRAVVRLAQDMGLGTVIEGVSEHAHVVRARELGCELAQGYWWSEPVSAGEVDARLAGDGFRAPAR